MVQWICPWRNGISHQVSLKPIKSVLFSQQLSLCYPPSIPPSKPVSPIKTHQQVPKEPGSPGCCCHFPLLCFMGCVSCTQLYFPPHTMFFVLPTSRNFFKIYLFVQIKGCSVFLCHIWGGGLGYAIA